MAQIEKYAGGYRIRAYVGRAPDGRNIRISESIPTPHTREGRRIATAAARRLEERAAEQRAQLATANTLAWTITDLAAAWINHKTVGWQPRTRDANQRIVANHIVPHIGTQPISTIKPRGLDRFYRQLTDDGVGGPTVRQVHAALSGMFTLAVRWDILPSNPAKHSEPPRPKEIQATPTFPTDRQRETAWDAPVPLYWRSLLRAAISTGMRPEELCGLEWRHLSGGFVTVEQAVTVPAGRGPVVGPTKSGKRRRFRLGDTAAMVFAEWAVERETSAPVELAGSGFVWYGADPAKPLRPDSISQWWARNRKGMGCEGLRWYDWRHWHATHLLSAGVSLQTVANRMGHTVAVLESTYSHFVDAADDAAAAVIDF